MASSDDEYVQNGSSGDENDMQLDDSRASTGRASTLGARPRPATKSKGKGKGQASGQTAAGRQRWEFSAQDATAASVRQGVDGSITDSVEGMIEAEKRRRIRQDTKPFQRGIIRHVVLVLDLSEAMLEKDMRPNRYIVMLNYVQTYVREFFEQNPISQMSIMGMYDGICIRISELSGNPTEHITAVSALRKPARPTESAKEPKGSPSLQNALEMSRAALYHTPSHGTREVIIILGALLSLDPGDIHATIRSCVRDKLRVSIIGMAGRLRICHEICGKTNGGDDSSYAVATDAQALRDLLMATTTPPAVRQTAEERRQQNAASLLMMGFPSRVTEAAPTLCACHGTLTRGGYLCSRCKAKACSLPATCPSCGLTLILSTHLARSYHHLFPLRAWAKVGWERARASGSTQCKACLAAFPPVPRALPPPGERARLAALDRSESSRYECGSCRNHFCVDCDVFCHEVVHNCPGCLSDPDVAGAGRTGSEGRNGAEPAVDGEAMDVG